VARVIVDVGPLVAYVDRTASGHEWAGAIFRELRDPLFTCEAVLSEVVFLLHRGGLHPDCVMEMCERDDLIFDFALGEQIQAVRSMMRKYPDRPMSLADACLVRMSELHEDSVVMTLDRDFLIYRRQGRRKIPLLAPFA